MVDIVSRRAKRVVRGGMRVLHEEGVGSFLKETLSFAWSRCRAYSIGRLTDAVVRRFLGDRYTLPAHLRYGGYVERRQLGAWAYRAITAHTGIPLRSNSEPSIQEPSLEGFRILDLGCGDGSLAVQFVENHPEADYVGLDIRKAQIRALQRRFSRTRYEFVHADIANEDYNPAGSIPPEDYTFPFDDGSFDLVIVKSVFTHMRPEPVRRYLSEIGRLLAPDGVAWTTWFLIPKGSDRTPKNGVFAFPYEHDGFYSNSRDLPEQAIAYDPASVEDLVGRTDLEIEETIRGWWHDVSEITYAASDCQDVMTLRRAR